MLAEALQTVQVTEVDDADWAAQFSHAITLPMLEYDSAIAASPGGTRP